MTRTTRSTHSPALSLVALLSACVSIPPEQNRVEAIIDANFAPLCTEHSMPGIVVAITMAGRQHFWTRGTVAEASSAPVTTDTLFEVGSISKVFTATLACLAAERGVMSFDDHPGKHMPELQGSPIDAAQLVHLGTYTAGGLPLQFPDDVDARGMVDWFRQWQPSSAPGTARHYSNPSLGLFGRVVARAWHRDFAELLEGELFAALGMHHSYVRIPAAELAHYAWGHNASGRRVRVNPGVLDAEAYGGKTSAADLLHFVEANLRPDALGPELAAAVRGTQVGRFRCGDLVQGLGWEQYPFPIDLERLLEDSDGATADMAEPAVAVVPPAAPSGGTWFQKTGSTGGFGAYVAFVPQRQIGLVMLGNRNIPIAVRIRAAHAVIAQLLADSGQQ